MVYSAALLPWIAAVGDTYRLRELSNGHRRWCKGNSGCLVSESVAAPTVSGFRQSSTEARRRAASGESRQALLQMPLGGGMHPESSGQHPAILDVGDAAAL